MRTSQVILFAAALAPAALTQTQLDLRTQSKSVDFSGASTTKPMKSGTAVPATCSVGELFWKTNASAGSNIFGCTATNTWTLQGATTTTSVTLGGDVTGQSGAAVVVRLQGRAVSATAPNTGQALVWNASKSTWEPQTVQTSSTTTTGGAQFESGLGDFAVTRVSDTQVTIAANPGGTAVRCGGSVTVFTGTVTINTGWASLGPGSALYPYIDCSSSPATMKVDSSSTVTQGQLTLTGATFGSANATGYPPDAIPLPRITGGVPQDTFDANPFTDFRGFLSTVVVKCGANLVRTASPDGSYMCGVDPTTTLAWTGASDFTSAAVTKPSRVVTSDPVSCSEGESYYNSTSHQRKDCTAANKWQGSAALLAFQPSTSAVAIGTGDTVVYSYSLPAGAIVAGGCATVELAWQMTSTGTGSVTPKFSFGATSMTMTAANAWSDKAGATLDICNLPGYTNRQQVNERALFFSAHTATGVPNTVSASENSQQAVTMSLVMNGAGSSGFAATGLWWKVSRN